MAADPLRQLGDLVRARREALGYSQEKLGEVAGLHRTYIGDIERGKRNVAYLNLIKLARALDVQPGDLFAR